MERSGSNPATTSCGIGAPSTRWMSPRSFSSSTQTSDTAWPGEPARPGPADAMDVVLGHHRQLEVDDVRQAVDVEAARGDLGGDEDRRPAGLEVGQRADPLSLALVAVDRDGRDAVAAELLGESIGAVLRAREHQRLVDGAGADEVAQQLALALAVDRVDDLRHERRGGVARRDLDRRRLVQEAAGERPDLLGERRREQQVLAAGGQDVEDAADVADEAHVEHAIGLVEDEDLDRREVDRPLADMIEQATGRGDDEVDPAPERVGLRRKADAAVDRGGADAPVATVDADALLDLERELAGRGEDEGADRPAAGARIDVRWAQALEQRQHEGRRLAGAGLGVGHEVTAGEDERDRLGLDGGGLGVALVRDGAEELGREPKGIEGHGENRLLTGPTRGVRGARSGRCG